MLLQIGDIKVTAGDVRIELVEQMKYLSVILDPEQNFFDPSDYTKHKLIGRMKMLRKLRPLISGSRIVF